MKCLVFSDSHSKIYYMREIIRMHSDAEAIFFLGDGLKEADLLRSEFPDKIWVAVRGNCDMFSYFGDRPAEKLESLWLSGYKISATHGDLYGAKYGLGGLIKLACDSGSDIVLFGHTHEPTQKYISDFEKPIYLFNPGSISGVGGSYGIMDLGKQPFFSHGEII